MNPRFRYISIFWVITILLCPLFHIAQAQELRLNDQHSSFQLEMEALDSATIGQMIADMKAWKNTYPDSALRLNLALLDQSKRIGYVTGIRDAMQQIGTLFSVKGMYESSMEFFHEMHEYCKRSVHLWECLPIVYNGIATLHHTQGNYRQAANFYYQSILLNERLALAPAVGGYNNLAATLMALGQYDEALHYLELAESLALESGQQTNLFGNIIVNKGQVWLTRQDWEKSAQYFQQALQMGKEQNLPLTVYSATTNMGTWHLWQGEYQKALDWYFNDTNTLGDIDPNHISTRKQNIGTCYLKMGHYKQAKNYFLQALPIAEKLHLRKREMELHGYLAEVYEIEKQPARALTHLKAHTILKDSISSLQIIDNAQQLNIKFRTAEKDRTIARNEQLISLQETTLKKKNKWISGITVGTLLLGMVLLFIVRNNRQKQKLHAKQLHIMEQQQQIERLNAIMQGEEQERIRLARDLHDGIGGMLAAVKMNFTTLQHEYDQYARTYDFINADELYKIREMLDETSNEVRRTAHNLMPDILIRHGLYQALKVYCDHINSGNQLYVNLQITGNVDKIDPAYKLVLYRTIQELVQNILKHSDASNALLQVTCTKDQISILVKDNGIGFDTERVAPGIGLQNIRSRVEAVHGTFSIISAVGSGTRIDIIFDLKEIHKIPLHENTDSYSG